MALYTIHCSTTSRYDNSTAATRLILLPSTRSLIGRIRSLMRRYLATLRLEYPNLSASSFRLLHLHESTAELTVTTGYSSKTAAGLRPTCSKFNTIFHRGCPSGQFLSCTKNRLPNSFLCPDSPCLSMSYINLYHQGTIIYT